MSDERSSRPQPERGPWLIVGDECVSAECGELHSWGMNVRARLPRSDFDVVRVVFSHGDGVVQVRANVSHARADAAGTQLTLRFVAAWSQGGKRSLTEFLTRRLGVSRRPDAAYRYEQAGAVFDFRVARRTDTGRFSAVKPSTNASEKRQAKVSPAQARVLEASAPVHESARRRKPTRLSSLEPLAVVGAPTAANSEAFSLKLLMRHNGTLLRGQACRISADRTVIWVRTRDPTPDVGKPVVIKTQVCLHARPDTLHLPAMVAWSSGPQGPQGLTILGLRVRTGSAAEDAALLAEFADRSVDLSGDVQHSVPNSRLRKLG